MPGNTKAIKAKLQTTSNLKKITRAMEMVARSKSKRSVDAALATRAYSVLALELMRNIQKNLGDQDISENGKHPLLEKRNNGRILVVHIASNKGLCGAYNTLLFKSLRRLVGGSVNADLIDVISIGKYAGRHTQKLGLTLKKSIEGLPEIVSFEHIRSISKELIEIFKNENYRTVLISYTKFENVFSLQTTVKKLLPVSIPDIIETIDEINREYEGEIAHDVSEKTEHDTTGYIYEPTSDILLEKLLPHVICAQLMQSVLEANASEQASRMVAMKNATDNATKFEKDLLLMYNRARQAAITTELSEIVAGAEAVSG